MSYDLEVKQNIAITAIVFVGIALIVLAIGHAVKVGSSNHISQPFTDCMQECRKTYAYTGDGYTGIENEELLKDCTDKCFQFPQEITADDLEDW